MRRSAVRALVRMTVAIGALAASATPSHAHAVGVSRGDYRADGATVHAELVFARAEILTALPELERDGMLSADALAQARAAVSAWVDRGLVIATERGACRATVVRAALTEQDGLALGADFRCPGPVTAFSVRLDLLADLSLGHRHLLTATFPGGVTRTVLYEAAPALALPAPGARASAPSTSGVVSALFRLGVTHILSGWDHLLFLLAVVLVGGSWRAVLGVVTAFTVAHSLTLALAVAQIWTPRPTLIEPAIALSIAWVGIENCLGPDVRRRWRLTFLFGLVHGFGFAGALQEIALARAQLPFALGAFNLGVEAGQIGVLAVVLPMVAWLGRRPWFARGGLQAASVAIAGVGLWWFVERVTS